MALKDIVTDEPSIPERAKYLFEKGFVPEIVYPCIGEKIKPYLLMIMRRKIINKQRLKKSKGEECYQREIETHVRARSPSQILQTRLEQSQATAYLHYYMGGEAGQKLKKCNFPNIDDVINAYDLFHQRALIKAGKNPLININDAWSLSFNLHSGELALLSCRACGRWFTTICATGINERSIDKSTSCPFCC